MNKSKLLAAAMTVFLTMSCSESKNNPFFQESQLPYGAVEFDKIRSTDYMPAFEEGFRQFKSDIDAVAACPDAPTFENTIEALEASGDLLSRVSGVFFNLMETDADDIMKETEEKVIPMQTDADSYLYMNDVIFKRIKQLYDNKDNIGLTTEQTKVLGVSDSFTQRYTCWRGFTWKVLSFITIFSGFTVPTSFVRLVPIPNDTLYRHRSYQENRMPASDWRRTGK